MFDFVWGGGAAARAVLPVQPGRCTVIYIWFKISDELAFSAVYPEDGDGKSF